MTTELIFFDIDDTLCRMGELDEDNHDALRELHHAGIKLAIATGRSPVIIPRAISQLIDEGLIDALVSINGQYNLAHGKAVSQYPLTLAQAQAAIDVCKRYRLVYKMDSPTHMAWSQDAPHYRMITQRFPDNIDINADYYKNQTIHQFSVLLTETEETQAIDDAFADIGFHVTRWQRDGADILPQAASKARGIADICRHFGIAVDNTMAFGDGLNDIEMLQFVGIGVAMGDGWQPLKDIADHVTGTIEENGIRKALKHFAIL